MYISPVLIHYNSNLKKEKEWSTEEHILNQFYHLNMFSHINQLKKLHHFRVNFQNRQFKWFLDKIGSVCITV